MENQLSVIVRESGLDETKAKTLLDKFSDYFNIAADWEKKAKTISVTKADQKVDMQMARTGRLFLAKKRIDIENARKQLKEQSLREGKAIDGIANVLKALIVPIEEYLDQQEHFIEIQAAKAAELARIEAEAKAEADRIAEEKRIAEEQERIRQDNIRLQKEALEREQQMKAEREKAEKAMKEEQAKAEAERFKQEQILATQKAKAEAEQKAIREKAEAERRKQEKALADQKAAAEAKQRAIEEQAKAEREKAEAERKHLEAELASMIECPKCHHKFKVER